jgi:hypothetical protein
MTHSPALTLARDTLTRARTELRGTTPTQDIDEALAAIDSELAASAAKPGTVQWCWQCGEGVLPGMCRKPGAASADAGRLVEEAKRRSAALLASAKLVESTRPGATEEMLALAVSCASELDAIIDLLAALSRPAPATTAPVSAQGDERAAAEPWKSGNEFLPYHPSASHVEPSYRDGWNACYKAALAARAQVAQG